MKEYIILSEKGFDSYSVTDNSVAHEEHRVKWAKELSSENAVVMEAEDAMMEILSEGEFAETLTAVYVKKGGAIEKASKEDIYSDAAERILGIMEALQTINGFFPMSQAQKAKAKEFVMTSLSSCESFGEEFRFPVFANYNYSGSVGGERTPSSLSISTDTPAWKEVMEEINKPDWMI